MRSLLVVGCLLPGCAESFETFELQPVLPTPIDLLVVLDDTTAMTTYLPRNPPPGQLTVPIAFYNGAPDVRIAVTTSTTGTLRTSAAVPSGVIEHRLDFEDAQLHTNYSGDLVDAIDSLMNVGTSSTAPNAVLASAELALHSYSPRNSAGLGILISTAGDDQSPGDVATYANTIRARGHAAISVVHGEPVQRLSEYADAFAERRMLPMADYNMTGVEVFTSLFRDGIPSDACFPFAPSDVESCQLFTSHDHVVRPLPLCLGSAYESARPCFELRADDQCSSGWVLLLGGGYSSYHPRIIGRCPTAG